MWFYFLLTISALTLALPQKEFCDGGSIEINKRWEQQVLEALRTVCGGMIKDLQYSWSLQCTLHNKWPKNRIRWKPHEVSYRGDPSVQFLMEDLKSETYEYWRNWFRGGHLLCESAKASYNKFFACDKYKRSGLNWLNDQVFGCVFHPRRTE